MNRQQRRLMARMARKGNKGAHTGCTCCECGGPLDPTIYHHTTPTSPAEGAEEWPPSGPLPEAGPSDLEDIAAVRRKDGIDTSPLDDGVATILGGDTVMVKFIVTERVPYWFPKELRSRLPTGCETEAMWVVVL